MQICPFSWDPTRATLTHYANIRVTIDLSYPDSDGAPIPYTSYSPVFQKLYEANINNFGDYRHLNNSPQSARILIIHGANNEATFISRMSEFVAWKRQKGFDVNVASTQVAGTSSFSIKNYIQSQYDNPATRPDFIIIVGDVTGNFAVPTFYMPEDEYPGDSDYPYTFLSGNDMLGDAFIGRISAENSAQLVTLFNKIYSYEKNVNLNPTISSWMNRMLIIGDPTYSGQSCVYTGQFVRETSTQANPDYEFVENYTGEYANTINSGINQGVGFFVYRGFYGVSGWSPSSSSLFNGFKLPHSVILTCETGSFAGGTSLTEAFTRLGTGATPAGAVTSIGMSTGGTHTAFNNALTSGIMTGIMCFGMRTMGEALLSSKLYLHRTYAADQLVHTNKMMHWCNLIGDPSLEVWVGLAKQMDLDVLTEIPHGTSVLEVSVHNSSQEPLEAVCVTAYSNATETVVAKAFSGANGVAVLVLPPDQSTDLLITASKHDFKPSQQIVEIADTGSLVYVSHLVIDDGNSGSSGNADGIAHASETLALQVGLRNTSTSVLSGLNGVLSTDNPLVQISIPSSTYPTLGVGLTSYGTQPFLIVIDPATPPMEDIRFSLAVTDAMSNTYSIVFYLRVFNAVLSVTSFTVNDNANGILDPGENSGLHLFAQNAGGYPATDLVGELRSLNSMLAVSDSVSYFGNILPETGQNSVDGFTVQAMGGLIPGMQIPMRLRLYNSSGFEQICLFNIPIGNVSQNTPLGPDEYGYLIYDITDTAYQDCPVYDWVDIAPSMGGMGVLVPDLMDSGGGSTEGDTTTSRTLKVLDLPFPFRFYGIDYRQITVCVNGFIAMGVTKNGDFRNAHLPGGQGPSPMIAPFWDDLYIPNGSGIYHYYDEAGHRYIIQYHNLKNGFDNTSIATFQVIFYDPVFYHSGLGDGNIKIQYKTFNNVDIGSSGIFPWQGNYCTVGIKDHTNTRGLEYSFNNLYPPAAAPLMAETALFITTVPYLHLPAQLVVEDMIVIDANQNMVIEPGEMIEVGIRLKNIGLSDATNIRVNLSSQSQYVSIQPSHSTYNDIVSFGSEVNRTPFTVCVADSCPNGTYLSFICEVNSAGASWSYPLSLKVQAPVVNYSGYYIMEADGNYNGILEPGENALLIVNYKNHSPLTASNIVGNISSSSQHITLVDTAQSIANIPPWSTAQAAFRINVSDTATLGINVSIILSSTMNQSQSHNANISLKIGSSGLYNDFELSNGNYLPSPSSDAWQWGVSQSVGAHSGDKVWGTLLNQQYPNNASWTLTSPSFYLMGSCVLEFWHYLDTQSGHDGGNVKITTNNNTWSLLTPEVGIPYEYVSALNEAGFSGSSGWSKVRIDLSAYMGNNVRFRWTFASDSSVQGQGWFIDDVITIGYSNFAAALMGQVSFLDPSPDYSNVWVTNQTGITSNPDASGNYSLYLPIGTHTVQASAPGFCTVSESGLSVGQDTTQLLQDFLLIELKPVNNITYAHTQDSILLSWEPPIEPFYSVMGYKVMRRMNAGAFQVAQISNETSYSETYLQHGSYQYYVIVLYDPAESQPSNRVDIQYPFLQDQEDIQTQLVTKLKANYPNPFNSETHICFDLATSAKVRLEIYNLRGQLVKTLCDTEKSSGNHHIVWNGLDSSNSRVSSGLYFYRLITPNYVKTRKMLLLK